MYGKRSRNFLARLMCGEGSVLEQREQDMQRRSGLRRHGWLRKLHVHQAR